LKSDAAGRAKNTLGAAIVLDIGIRLVVSITDGEIDLIMDDESRNPEGIRRCGGWCRLK
jgi:hypothetical protein